MPWGALIAGAISYFGASQDQDAVSDANAANARFLFDALRSLGWSNELSYKQNSQGYYLGNILSDMTGTSGQGQMMEWAEAYLGDNIDRKNEAAKALADRYGIDATQLDQLAGQALQQYNKQADIQTAYGMVDERFGAAESLLKQSAQALTQGYTRANRAIAQTAAGAQQGIARAGTQSLAAGKAQLAQSGLLNTSLSGQLARRTRADTGYQMTQLASALAPIRAQGQAALGEAQSRGYGALAGLQQNRAQMDMSLALQKIHALLGVTNMPGPGFMQSIGGGQGAAALGQMFGNADWSKLFSWAQ